MKIGGLEAWEYTPKGEWSDMAPIVFVPGASARGIMASKLALTLKELGRRVYLISLPGHGESELWKGKPLGHHSLEDFSQGLERFLETLGARVDAWGHSMGGAVIQKLFSSGRIRNTALIGSVAAGIPLVSTFAVARRAAKYWKAMLFSRPFRYGEDDYLSMLLNETPREEAKSLFGKTVLESGRAIAQVCTGGFRVPHAVRIERLLIVSARSDLIIPPYMGKRLVRRYDRRRLTKHLLINGDHMGIFTAAGQNNVSAIEQCFHHPF
jgi:pimeloyl-ACP methyl ester carboxylesterase